LKKRNKYVQDRFQIAENAYNGLEKEKSRYMLMTSEAEAELAAYKGLKHSGLKTPRENTKHQAEMAGMEEHVDRLKKENKDLNKELRKRAPEARTEAHSTELLYDMGRIFIPYLKSVEEEFGEDVAEIVCTHTKKAVTASGHELPFWWKVTGKPANKAATEQLRILSTPRFKRT